MTVNFKRIGPREWVDFHIASVFLRSHTSPYIVRTRLIKYNTSICDQKIWEPQSSSVYVKSTQAERMALFRLDRYEKLQRISSTRGKDGEARGMLLLLSKDDCVKTHHNLLVNNHGPCIVTQHRFRHPHQLQFHLKWDSGHMSKKRTTNLWGCVP